MYLLSTERLQLRELTESDEDARFTLALMSDPDFHRYIGDRGVRTVEDARNYNLRGPIAMYRDHGFGMLRVELKDGTAIGQCGLLKRDGLDDVDIGFAFLPEYRGRGYALEAAQAMLKWGETCLGFRRIVAIATPENRASLHLLETLGMKRERMIRLPGSNENLVLLGWHSGRSKALSCCR
ncbi:GNAT family N-acetyltransferase [Microbulbifer harenosus]|uniref:GNAT family N-acetyltransferase n=1 Tax=Microbulbifer harenosus TaxID=2576840 RepID=A0ABY2UM63_9GAMM|nr:GNAT family N-acetyltransferase [Microbulbifer harenosus]TLM79630.1 GNAT family N-acetyltransferase [Microbulbifer harenosus]